MGPNYLYRESFVQDPIVSYEFLVYYAWHRNRRLRTEPFIRGVGWRHHAFFQGEKCLFSLDNVKFLKSLKVQTIFIYLGIIHRLFVIVRALGTGFQSPKIIFPGLLLVKALIPTHAFGIFLKFCLGEKLFVDLNVERLELMSIPGSLITKRLGVHKAPNKRRLIGLRSKKKVFGFDS